MEIEDLRINQEVVVYGLDNYKASYAESVPFKGRITQLTDYPTIWVKSLKTDKLYEIYPTQLDPKYYE